jgi:hypothetical protein
MVSHAFNKIVHSTIEHRKKYLEPYIQKQPTLMPLSEQYIAWHSYGSACAFVTTTGLIMHSDNLIYLCRLQIGDDGVVANQAHCLMRYWAGAPLHWNGESAAYCAETMEMVRNTYYKIPMLPKPCFLHMRILLPIFDRSGNSCVYHYRVDDAEKTTNMTEVSINNQGTATTSKCMFEFRGQEYSFGLLAFEPFLNAFINSSWNSSRIQGSDNIKTFMSDGVTINGAPLTKIDIHAIDRIVNSSEWSVGSTCVIS